MILRDASITKHLSRLIDLEKTDPSLDPDRLPEQINPNSLDLTISSRFKRPIPVTLPVTYGFEDQEEQDRYKSLYWIDEENDDYITLEPGQLVLGCTREYIKMPRYLCGQLFTKSSLGRMFINHMMAGVIDSGFHGRLTLELKNDGIHTVRIPVGSRIVQMYLMYLDGIPEKGYGDRNSKYKDAETVECAK